MSEGCSRYFYLYCEYYVYIVQVTFTEIPRE